MTARSIGAPPTWAGVTGHTYIVYGPLCNGAVTLMFEGVPTYPDAGRFWQVVDKHRVNVFYTRAHRVARPDGGRAMSS